MKQRPSVVSSVIAICWCFFLPCVIFVGLCYVATFHNSHALIADIIVAILVLLLGVRSTFGSDSQPAWYRFLFLLCAAALIAGIACGLRNAYTMAPFYAFNDMAFYFHVDPRNADSVKLQDAGRLLFKEGSNLDLSHAEGVKNGAVYCVAPVTFKQAKLASYDFWAVGYDCCSGLPGDFHCGAYNNPKAYAGLRSLDDNGKGYFRMAVQEAEAAFNLTVRHPIFLQWTQDPVADVDKHLEQGYLAFQKEVAIFCVAELFVVVVASLVFNKVIAGD
jgi:hypothetical protein